MIPMTEFESEQYLETRAYNEGISVEELLEMTPSSVADSPVESATFWQQRDYSHLLPVSTHPHLANDPDNAMPEDPSVNRARGAEEMTALEEFVAHFDNEVLATQIDLEFTGDVLTTWAPVESPFIFF